MFRSHISNDPNMHKKTTPVILDIDSGLLRTINYTSDLTAACLVGRRPKMVTILDPRSLNTKLAYRVDHPPHEKQKQTVAFFIRRRRGYFHLGWLPHVRAARGRRFAHRRCPGRGHNTGVCPNKFDEPSALSWTRQQPLSGQARRHQ